MDQVNIYISLIPWQKLMMLSQPPSKKLLTRIWQPDQAIHRRGMVEQYAKRAHKEYREEVLSVLNPKPN